MNKKQHEIPEFQVVRMSEANARFYAASTPPVVTDATVQSAMMSYGQSDINSAF